MLLSLLLAPALHPFLLPRGAPSRALPAPRFSRAAVLYDNGYDGGASSYEPCGDYSSVDAQAVQALVDERAALRRERDYAAADGVREELRRLGVSVDDREMTWFVGGDAIGGRGEYTRDPRDTAPIDAEAVEALLEERSEFRRQRDFNNADAVRDELRQMGVMVVDKSMTWYVSFDDDRSRYSRSDQAGSYRRQQGDDAPIDEARVMQLLSERSSFRRNRDFQSADAVRDELRDLGVVVRDKEGVWFVEERRMPRREAAGQRRERPSDEFGPLGHDYAQIDGDDEPPAALLAAINELLAKRLNAKLARRFNDADKCRDELKAMGVKLNDKTREWQYAPAPSRDLGPLGHDYARAPDDKAEMSEEELAAVNQLLAERLQAKLNRDFDVADAALESLRLKGVFVNDKLRGWRADGGAFPTHMRVAGDGDKSCEVDEARVLELMGERSIARRDQEFDRADAIVSSLRDEHSVVLNDKAGTWKVVLQPGGFYRVGPRVGEEQEKAIAEKLELYSSLQAEEKYEESSAVEAELAAMKVFLNKEKKSWRFSGKD